jgi:opacity protein-like surface antigen
MFYHFDVVSFGFALWWFPSVGVELDNPADLAAVDANATVAGAKTDDELDYNAVVELVGEPGRWFGLGDLDEFVLVLDAQGGFTHWIGDSDSENATGFNVGAGLGVQFSPDDAAGMRISGRYQYVSVGQDRDLATGPVELTMATHRAMVVFSFLGTE